MTWHTIPDILAFAVLIYAFLTVSRPDDSGTTRLWLIGWITILLHFVAEIFSTVPGPVGVIATTLSISALTWCALLFMRSVDPSRTTVATRVVTWGLGLVSPLFYFQLMQESPATLSMRITGSLYALVPLVALVLSAEYRRHAVHRLLALIFLLLGGIGALAPDTPVGTEWLFEAPLCLMYVGACLSVAMGLKLRPGGAVVTVVGLFAWAMVFPVASLMSAFAPEIHVDGEVWNLPKYVVAVGMILSLLEDQLKHNQFLAEHDQVTGLPNRRVFNDRLSGAMERARRASSTMALLFIDLDGFKQVNDTRGHHVGDEVLKIVGHLLASRLRRSDTIARVGGDEFAVILEAPTQRHEAQRVRAALEDLLRDPLPTRGQPVSLGASIGIAIFPDDAQEAELLLILADQRMYEAKREHAASREGLRPVAA